MPYFSSLGDGATVLNILQLHPRAGRALTEYHEIVMRGRSALNESQRELVAAYVSGLNACQYCHGVHSVTAEAFGLPEGAIVALLDDIEAADVEAKLKPILKYVGS